MDSDIEMEDSDEGLTEAEKLYHDELWKAKFPGTLMAQSYGSDDEDEDGDWATDSEDGVGKESLLEEDDSEADDWEVDEDASEDDWEENELQSYATSSVLRSGNARYKA